MPRLDPDFIWIADAVKEYNRSRKWLDEQVEKGKLHYAEAEGDRRIYLLRSELEAFLTVHVKRAGEKEQAG